MGGLEESMQLETKLLRLKTPVIIRSRFGRQAFPVKPESTAVLRPVAVSIMAIASDLERQREKPSVGAKTGALCTFSGSS
jgi:hypothetical protein